MSDAIRVAPLTAPLPALDSGRPELDRWLADYGWSATRSGSARVWLAERDEGGVGYFALSAGSVDPVHAGARARAGMPRHPTPVVLLARLAVGEDFQGQGIGRALVGHAARITIRAAALVAVRALVVDALDEATAVFYERVGFTPNAVEPLRLEALVKDLQAALRKPAE